MQGISADILSSAVGDPCGAYGVTVPMYFNECTVGSDTYEILVAISTVMRAVCAVRLSLTFCPSVCAYSLKDTRVLFFVCCSCCRLSFFIRSAACHSLFVLPLILCSFCRLPFFVSFCRWFFVRYAACHSLFVLPLIFCSSAAYSRFFQFLLTLFLYLLAPLYFVCICAAVLSLPSVPRVKLIWLSD